LSADNRSPKILATSASFKNRPKEKRSAQKAKIRPNPVTLLESASSAAACPRAIMPPRSVPALQKSPKNNPGSSAALRQQRAAGRIARPKYIASLAKNGLVFRLAHAAKELEGKK
jgi:hypothetical protein